MLFESRVGIFENVYSNYTATTKTFFIKKYNWDAKKERQWNLIKCPVKTAKVGKRVKDNNRNKEQGQPTEKSKNHVR